MLAEWTNKINIQNHICYKVGRFPVFPGGWLVHEQHRQSFYELKRCVLGDDGAMGVKWRLLTNILF
jgi:hypothetical protein